MKTFIEFSFVFLVGYMPKKSGVDPYTIYSREQSPTIKNSCKFFLPQKNPTMILKKDMVIFIDFVYEGRDHRRM